MSLTLYNGDCLEVMKDLSANSVDLIICDLPYGCLTGGGITKKETAEKYGRKGTEGISGCAWDVKIDLEAFWKEVKRIRKNEHTPCIHFCTTKFGFELYSSNPSEFRYDLVWDKQRGVSFLSANKMPMRSHEMVYVFSKAGAYYNRVDITGDFKGWSAKIDQDNKHSNVYQTGMPNGWKSNGNDGTKRCVLSVINNSTSSRKGGHPTEKPIDLYKFLIERYCPPGGTVLDPTFGSGNSGAAAEALGRHYIGVEKDKGFFDKAVKRLEAE
tara:strand:- start:3457 stop:4263 length:807 start_codon:yes stop_codon:yes gene_type:complete